MAVLGVGNIPVTDRPAPSGDRGFHSVCLGREWAQPAIQTLCGQSEWSLTPVYESTKALTFSLVAIPYTGHPTIISKNLPLASMHLFFLPRTAMALMWTHFFSANRIDLLEQGTSRLVTS